MFFITVLFASMPGIISGHFLRGCRDTNLFYRRGTEDAEIFCSELALFLYSPRLSG